MVQVDIPAGLTVELELEQCLLGTENGQAFAQCAVRKDGGDDPDTTHGTLIFATVTEIDGESCQVEGGEGVGRVTRGGLDQPVGNAAINKVPRQMILSQLEQAVAQSGKSTKLQATITVPKGELLAKTTFNPRLGIVGGISILGTSGLVRPMSETAMVDSLLLELDMLSAAGIQDIILTLGNYGEDFCRNVLKISLAQSASCSNYLGQAIDHAVGLKFRSLLLVGHLGKLAKVAAGSFQTHSKVSDGRREVFTTHAALCGGEPALLQALFSMDTRDQGVALLEENGLKEQVLTKICSEIQENCVRRAGETIQVETLVFSHQYGILGKSEGAEALCPFT